MRKIFTLLCAMLSFAWAHAQVNYTFSAGTRTYAPLSGGTSPTFTNLGVSGAPTSDEGSANGIAIPFTFTYNGTAYTQFNINTNGFIALGAPLPLDLPSGSNGAYNNSLATGPNTSAAGVNLNNRRPLIAPLWDDLDMVNTANITYGVVGTAPNRTFVIQFANALWDWQASSAVQSFQIRLVETSNVIEFSYLANGGSVAVGSGGASVGITAIATGSGNFISVTPGTNTASSTTENATITTVIPSNTLYTFTPQTQTPCAGTPTVGNAIATPSSGCGATTVNFSIGGLGNNSGFTYQWQSSAAGANNFTNISGATNATYSASVSVTTDYRVVVTCSNSAQSTPSGVARVTIGTTPANDQICDAVTLTRNGVFSCVNTSCATVSQSSDTTFKGSAPNNTVWYQFTPTTTGRVEFRFRRPTGVTTGLLNGWAVLTTANGFCPDQVTTLITPNDSAAINFNLTAVDSVSWTTPVLTANTTYYLYIDGFSGSAGQACIGMPAPPATVPACSTPLAPANGATNVAVPVTLRWTRSTLATSYNVFLSTDNGITYNNVGAIADTVASLTLQNAGTYFWYVVPTNVTGAATGCQSNARNFTTVPPPSNDSCGASIGIGSVNAITGNNTLATQSLAPVTCDGTTYAIARDVWYRFTANSTATASIRVVPTAGSTLDPVVALYTGAPSANCAGFTLVTCRDTYVADTISAPLTAGTTYYLRIWGFNNTVGGFTVQVNGVVLPVALASFEGERKGAANLLRWTTSQEQNNKGFEIQRSADGVNFSKIGFVAAQSGGNSSQPLNYNFADERAGSATAYYRLQQVDLDGRSSLSKVVKIEGLRTTKVELTNVFPNPVRNIATIALNSPEATKLTLVLSDVNGRIVNSQPYQLVSGDNTLRMSLQGLAAGQYMLKAIAADGSVSNSKMLVKE